VTFTDGHTTDVTWSASTTEGEVHLQSAQPAVEAEIDAERLLLDWDRGNNRAFATVSGKAAAAQATPATEDWLTYTTQDGLNAPTVRSLLFGNDRRLYVGSGHEGRIESSSWNLNYFDGQWHDLVPDSSRGVTILSMAQARNGTLWVGGHGVLWRVKGDQAKRFILKELRYGRVGKASFAPHPDANSEIPGSTVFALLCDGHGNVWVGTDHGVSTVAMDQGTWRHFSQADKLPGQAVLALARDDAGVVWAGTDRGIASFTDGQWTPHPRYARDDMILAIASDSQGTVWFGTYRNGILGLGNGSLRHFTSASSPLPHDMVPALTCDPDGRLWAGTADGLVCFDGQSWRHFHQRNSGLPSNRIQRLAVDDSGHLWIATDVGLTCYDY
jgi:ligand-binding sensor domain-containing protein